MQVRVVTMRYQEGLQGFPEDALRAATFGKTVLDVRECPHSDATRRRPVPARSQHVATLPCSDANQPVFGIP